MRATTELVCTQCAKNFSRKTALVNADLKRGRKNTFCSVRCWSLFNRPKHEGTVTTTCGNCKTVLTKSTSIKKGSKSGFIFCSKSCAATYNNKHKTHGTRRSKLETYIEEQLKTDFPQLTILYNSKEAIESELDFFFPQLRLAIELNGIFHYEPIYGTDKFDKIQNNDRQKILKCAERGIELCIIDSSQCKYLNDKAKLKYYSIVKEIINLNIGRLTESTCAEKS